MSIDLDVFPTTPTIVTWEDVIPRWRERLGPLAELLGEKPVPIRVGSHQVLKPGERFSFDGYYYLNLAVENTLGISVFKNSKYLDEFEYLADYGRNLDVETVRHLAVRWRASGYHYEIESFAGRGKHERRMMAALALALAEACQGYIVLMNEGFFDLGAGVYTPEEFRQA